MGARSKIEWTTSTWPVVTGCTPISPGCDHCYAARHAHRFAGTKAWPNGFGVTLWPDRVDQPLRWRAPRKVFVCSTGDLFHAEVRRRQLHLRTCLRPAGRFSEVTGDPRQWPPTARHRAADACGCWIQGSTPPTPCCSTATRSAVRVGKLRAGRVLDGCTWDQYPDPATETGLYGGTSSAEAAMTALEEQR